jgi:hypothetical protein
MRNFRTQQLISFLLIGLFGVSLCQGQMIKSFQNDTRLSLDDLGKITLNKSVKLEDIFLMDKNFDGLKSLGTPLDVEYKDYIIHHYWSYTYENVQLEYVNTGGFVEISRITLFPSESSTIKIGDVVFNAETDIEQIVSTNSEGKILKNENKELKVDVLTKKGEQQGY